MEKLKVRIRSFALILAVLIFSWGILFVSLGKIMALTEPINSPTPTSVDYYLAYPGILPGHFLYPIKMVRDRIWLSLTTNPLQKARLLLLFADKRLGAGKALIEEEKEKLGISTLTKAEKYLERAVIQGEIARQKGEETRTFIQNLRKAAKKHEEILLGLQEKVSQEGKDVIEGILRYPREISKKAEL